MNHDEEIKLRSDRDAWRKRCIDARRQKEDWEIRAKKAEALLRTYQRAQSLTQIRSSFPEGRYQP